MFGQSRTQLAVTRFMSASARRQGGSPYKLGDQAHRIAMEKKHNIFRVNPVRQAFNIYAAIFVVPAMAFCAFLGPENCKSLGLPWNHANPCRNMQCDGEPNNTGMGFLGKLMGFPIEFLGQIMITARYGKTGDHLNFGVSDNFGQTTKGPIKSEGINGLALTIGGLWAPILAVPAFLLAIRRYKPRRNHYTFMRSGAYRMPDAAQMPYAVAGTVIRTWFYWEVMNFFLVTKPFEWYEQQVLKDNFSVEHQARYRFAPVDVNAHLEASSE
jgi:hypothetical protein